MLQSKREKGLKKCRYFLHENRLMYRVNSTNDTSVVKVFPEGDEYFKGKLFITCSNNRLKKCLNKNLKKIIFGLKKYMLLTL